MDKAGDAKAVFRLVVLNGVAAGNNAAGLHGLAVAALQNAPDGLQRKAAWNAQKIHGQLWHAAHGVNVAEGVGRGDLAEKIRIVYDGREKIHRLDHGHLRRDLINTGVIAAVIAHQQAFVRAVGQIGKDLRQGARPQLCRSPGGGGHLRQGKLFGTVRHGSHLKISQRMGSDKCFSACWRTMAAKARASSPGVLFLRQAI